MEHNLALMYEYTHNEKFGDRNITFLEGCIKLIKINSKYSYDVIEHLNFK